VEEAIRAAARQSKAGGIVVGDFGDGPGGIGEAVNLPGTQGRQGSAVELLSDPLGVDFRPYLTQILASVRRNWFAVIPESAKLGRSGRVQIQFAISRDGRVPRLVIASPSGAEALDRAAVAGISASNPFPPLPAEFRGEQVRLQFTFLYNLPRRGP
jgi:TonB family protein